VAFFAPDIYEALFNRGQRVEVVPPDRLMT
jgi:hypothetical protein